MGLVPLPFWGLNCYFDVVAMLSVVVNVVLYCSIVDSFWIWIDVY
jgi:hypothetical protein